LFNVVESNNAADWNNLVGTSEFASAYHLWEWGEALSQTYGYKKHYLVNKRANEVVGIFPLVHVKSMLFGNRLISLPFCEYGGILLRSGLNSGEVSSITKVLLDATTKLARTIGAEYIEIREPFNLGAHFQAGGYGEYNEYVTFKIDLTKGTKQLWSDLEKKTRNAVRKAAKSAVQVEVLTKSEQLKSYYELYLQTQKRLGSPPHCYELFRNLFDLFSPSGKLRMILARHQDKPIAGIIIFSHGDKIFWWNNVSDVKHRNLNPTNLLLWNALEWGAEKGYHVMDMGRTRKDTTIYDFKSGWGGQETTLRDYICFLNSEKKQLPDPSQKKFQYLSKVWSFLPINVSKKLGPRIISGIAL
jgi:serine/alanine adding enzyme